MNTFSRFLALAALLSFSSVSWGLMIGSDDVGEIDPLLAQTDDLGGCGPGGSETAEECWINSVLAPETTTYGVKEETVSYQFVNGSDSILGFLLDSPTEYFMIKNAQWWGLFENVSNFDWAVINTALLDSGFNLPDGSEMTISHVATIGDAVKVPEPGILSLFALGLFAMGLRGRKISKRS